MPNYRSTVDRETIVSKANNMIKFLADSGTKEDYDKRMAIINITSSILLEGNSYHGFMYLNKPTLDNNNEKVYDPSRVAFY